MKNKVRKCKLCSQKVAFEEKTSKTTRKFQCPNCKGYLVPFKMRHFDNPYNGYPKWISQEDWKNKRFVDGLILAGATMEEIDRVMND